MIPLQCKQSTRVSRDYFKMRFDLSERIIWAGPNTMIYFHYTWKKNNYCRIHHLWIRQSVLNVDNVIVIAALLYNNLAMTSPYWCPPSRLCLLHDDSPQSKQWPDKIHWSQVHSAVWYKTKFGSQNFGYQIWWLFCNTCNVLKNMFNMSLIIMW